MNKVSTKDDRPSRPERASASASETRKRSPPERLRVRPDLVPYVAINDMQREIGRVPPCEFIAGAQCTEVIIRQLHHMIECDARYKATETIATGRADGFVDGLPNFEIRSCSVDFHRYACGCLARLIVSRERSGKHPRPLLQIPDFRCQHSVLRRLRPRRRLSRRSLRPPYLNHSGASQQQRPHRS